MMGSDLWLQFQAMVIGQETVLQYLCHVVIRFTQQGFIWELYDITNKKSQTKSVLPCLAYKQLRFKHTS